MLLATTAAWAFAADRPNILLIYADDLGYGDIGPNGATRVATPALDRLATQGLSFRDAHSASATSTPSRYALMTGEYAWRRKGTGVLPATASLIIEPGRQTLPSMLQAAGYTTGIVGKWHLGLGANGPIDWNGAIAPGPLEVGFHSAFIIPATGDRVPCVYVEDHKVVGLDPADPITVDYSKPIGTEPTGKNNSDLLITRPSHGHDMTIVNGISRIGYMSGGTAARWVDTEIADTLATRAVKFVEANADHPFFLVVSTHDIHVPRVPHERFRGRTGMGPRGDAIAEFDDTVGQLLNAIDRLHLADNTLVIVTSDNGPVVDDGYQDEAVARLGDHRPSGPYRGGKYSNFEGGTRVPFLVRWPGRIQPGTTSDALICQVDLLASLASLVGQPVAASARDSQNVLPALLGQKSQGRTELVEHASVLSLRDGAWKYIRPSRGPKILANTATETGNDPDGQLFDLSADPGETHNLLANHPDRASAMKARLDVIQNTPPSQ
jgi:arylsulfatase A-like enzyme